MKKILVAYASRMGSTGEIALAIGEELTRLGFHVDVRACGRAPDARNYAAVVVGSGLYIGRWDKSAVDYLKQHQDDLADRPTWLFQSGPCGEGAEHQQVEAPRTVLRLATELGIAPPMTFGGRLERDKATGPFSRWMATGVHAGDFRDFDAIRDWARSMAAELRTRGLSHDVAV